MLTDSIPPGTAVVAPLPSGCTGSGPVTCDLGAVAAGETRTFEIVVEIPESTPLGPLSNVASITSATGDPDQVDNTATATVEAIAQADVVLEKTLVTDPPVAGEPLVYELTLTNRGPTIAPSPSLSDPLPAGTTFESFTAPGGECQLDEAEDVPTASCSLAPLPVGSSVTATLTVDTEPDLSSVTNTGFSGSGGLDEVPADNEDTVTTALVREGDLTVEKSGPTEVSAAAAAEYVLTYTNDGPSTATGVVVTDTLPAGLTPRSVDGCTIVANTVTCEVEPLAPGATGSITITADVDPDLPLGTALTDLATIGSDAVGFTDPDPSNDTSSFTSTVQAQNDVGVTVTADESEVLAGDEATFAVVVTNNGPHLASGVELINELPPEVETVVLAGSRGRSMRLFAQVPDECQADGTTATCELGDLAVDETRTLVFGGSVADGTPPGTELVDTASVSFDGTDAVDANNTDSDTTLVVADLGEPPPPPPPPPPPTPSTTAPPTSTSTVPGAGGSGAFPSGQTPTGPGAFPSGQTPTGPGAFPSGQTPTGPGAFPSDGQATTGTTSDDGGLAFTGAAVAVLLAAASVLVVAGAALRWLGSHGVSLRRRKAG